MTIKRNAFKAALALGGVALAGGLLLTPSPAAARVSVHFGVGLPFYGVYGAPYYSPYYAPYYYGPPVAYAPPPVVYADPPAVAYSSAPQAQTWYYCNDPKGYYPYVNSCAAGWQQVPAQPAPQQPQAQ